MKQSCKKKEKKQNKKILLREKARKINKNRKTL
jgi:hypothetical protein